MTIPASTASIETHLSRLFFTDDRVYKLLKPVTLPFVDFSDTKTRCDAATHEFERNQGISPDVYLGLADVFEDGVMTNRMIVMRRLPDDRELRRLLNKGADDTLIPMVARYLASLHAGLQSLTGQAAEPAALPSITKNWADNLESIEPHVGHLIPPEEFDEVQALVDAYLAGRSDLFESRIAAGWVRDGHGDLRAEHIYCTEDGPRIIDCVAFDDRLRVSDALADIAFLAMDLDRLVGRHAAITLMKSWNEFTNEHHPSSLAHFYVAYRAHVRCKIACLRYQSGQAGAAETARSYHAQALRHLRLARIEVILVGGGPGTGKSTIAESVASYAGAAWLRADEIRKDVAGVGHDNHAFAAPGEGIYTSEVSARMQAELVRQTRMLLRNGVSVVIDATWRSAQDRADLRRVADECSVQLTELRCAVPDPVAKERIARRMASVYNPSDATPELVDYLADRFDAWPEAITIDTSHTIAESLSAARRALSTESLEVPDFTRAERFRIDLAAIRDIVLINSGL